MDSNWHLNAVSPLDGRYAAQLQALAPYTSEAALIRYRVRVEAAWLLHLAEVLPDMSCDEPVRAKLIALRDQPESVDAAAVKAWEAQTNHDVKAVEYYLRDALRAVGASDALLAYIHFACTSEDINNLAYGLMLNDIRDEVLLPQMNQLLAVIAAHIDASADLAMLSRTHGQTASPTTLGKELAVFKHRLARQRDQLQSVKLEGKMSGAVGNYNAHVVAFADIDWQQTADTFLSSLGLKQNPLTTQIENHDTLAEYLDAVRRFNTILLGMSRDVWSYISIGYFSQVSKATETGSSTMPHKVNPIDFENAEGNLGLSISLSQHLVEKLPISRWQRDLSDSTVLRNLGVVCGYASLAYTSMLRGFGKITPNAERISADLDQAWEVIAEPIQTVMRRYGVMDAYERLKEATRGRAVDQACLAEVVRGCDELPEAVKEQLLALTPAQYTGIAATLAKL